MANKVIDGQSFSFNDLIKTGTLTPYSSDVEITAGSIKQIGNIVFISALLNFPAGYQVSHPLCTISGVSQPDFSPTTLYALVGSKIGGATIMGNIVYVGTNPDDSSATLAYVSGQYMA